MTETGYPESFANAAEPDICIVGGAGHVGLPLGIVFASKGFNILIHDLNAAAMARVATGEMPFMEEGAEPLLKTALAEGRLAFSAEPTAISRAPNVIVTIGTPVDEFQNPDHKVFRSWIENTAEFLRDEQLIILRSTVYPGTTEWLAEWLRTHNKTPRIAFCPERIVQGYAVKELTELPQIVSGTTPEAAQAAGEIFARVAPEIITLEPQEAEFAKLFANAYRYIQFAAANQFYMVTQAAGVDYYKVLSGMKKNYPRLHDIPKAGFAAGPCLFKDTAQLAAFAQNNFPLGHAAMNVNEGLVLFLVNQILDKGNLSQQTVGLLGMAFKANNDDTRSSLSYKVKKALLIRAREVLTTDPHVTDDPTLLPLDEVIDRSDVLVLCAPHKEYANLDTQGKPIIDIWGYL